MKISIVTLFPEMFAGFLQESIVKRAQEKKLVEVAIVHLRDFAVDEHGTVDDRPYGGGAGMMLRIEPVVAAIESLKPYSNVVLTSPRGRKYDQEMAQKYAKLDHLVLLAAHYEGVDERISTYIDEEVSIGDYVLTGGELPVAVIADSIIRLIPGVLKKTEATEIESFFEVEIDTLLALFPSDEDLLERKSKGKQVVRLLEYGQYTRPDEFRGEKVPEVLLSGDHQKIRDWQLKDAYQKTKKLRPDIL